MNPNQLASLLALLTGQLHTANNEEEKSLEGLQKSLAEALLQQDPATIRSQEFLFERSDLFITQNLPGNRLEKINELVKKVSTTKPASDLRVFIRQVPVRSTQLPGSITAAAAGSRVTTVGPIRDAAGRLTWFDFVKVQKLIALYIQGQPQPAILFDATFNAPRFQLINGKPAEITKSFTVIPDSVWIRANLLSPAAPAGDYCGLRVKGGTITLDADPFMQNNQLTIAATTNVVCKLTLEQNNSFGSDPTSPYGIDARNAQYELPASFNFSFKNTTKQIQAVGTASWKVYGHAATFTYANGQNCIYNPLLRRVAIPVQCNATDFTVSDCQSPFCNVDGSGKILNSWWTIPVATIDVANPTEADGNGAMIIECNDGLDVQWPGLQNKTLHLPHPFIIGEPGRIGITEVISNGAGAIQSFEGWKDANNPFGTSMEWKFKKDAFFLFNTLAQGDELAYGITDCDIKTDRPVKVNGEAVAAHSKNSAWILAVSKLKQMLMVIDNDMLWDNKLPAEQIPVVKPYALAMHNALFTVTPPNSLVLFADCDAGFKKMLSGKLYLGFGLFSYLPTLPDPYAANLGLLKAQFDRRGVVGNRVLRGSTVYMWLIALVQWEKQSDELDKAGVSFHFAPLQSQLEIIKDPNYNPDATGNASTSFETAFTPVTTDQPAGVLFASNRAVANPSPLSMRMDDFALLDVSSKANQMGVAFSKTNNFLQQTIARKYDIQINDAGNSAIVFPFQVSGLDVVTAGMNAQSFTVPAIAWEPVFNLTPPSLVEGMKDENNVPLPPPYDPPAGFNYYENDGFATRAGNLSKEPVPLSPIPMAKYLAETYKNKKDGKTYAIFNLPFGMLAITILDNKSSQIKTPEIRNVMPVFNNYLNGGTQLELVAGTSFSPNDDDHMFEGYTIQLININRADGSSAKASTLAGTPTQIFNNEFFTNKDNLPARPGVPLTNIGLSGYGASTFSNWHNKEALFAQTSQAQFNVITGRTSHEVVQVKSMLYPWGIRVVRTITLFRLANGYVARIDSGWKAESDGKYDFSWKEPIMGGPDGKTVVGKIPHDDPFEFHPGIVHGLFGVRNIQEKPKVFPHGSALLYAVTFDADVELENVTEGGQANRVTSKGITGYVQISPAGKPIDKNDFVALLQSENNSIGGPIGCIIKVAGTVQRMRLDRFDVSASVDAANNAVFVAAARGSVIMPKDGSWSMVQHNRGNGDVSPLPEQLSVPLVRTGKYSKGDFANNNDKNNLQRIAHPADLLKIPDASTINFGFLQNMGTQKVLFMTPGFKPGIASLLSKTPPLLADAYRLMNSKGIFPNIGNAETDFGQVISLLKGIGANGNPLDAFSKVNVPDVGQVFDLLQLKAKEEAGKLLDQGYKLAKGAINGVANDALKFDLPAFDYPLINFPGKLVINIQYKADSKPKGQPAKNYVGKFDFDVDSFAGDLAKTWKGRMNNLVMVVTIGPLTDVMKIKGNFNSQKGKEVDLGSSDATDNPGLNLPTPEIEFSDAVEPVIRILEILASLSSGEYGDALKKGLKIAMSNSANVWEYKFEATKEIPLVRFPPTKELYESPTTPLKLEASMSLGVVFNAALKVTSDPSQLLPTAGGFFQFHGGLQVMCVSLAAATVYAVGQVDLKLEADTSPKVGVTLKFGFGAQLTVGLPVVGHASVLFMVGVEIYADSGSVVRITAFMLFRGNAELLGGLVSITITIEARGTIEKTGAGAPANCIVQVTFAIDISIFLVIDINFSESWEESRQIA